MTTVGTERHAVPHRLHPPFDTASSDTSSRTVLVADSDADAATSLAEACAASGFALAYCDDGSSALYQAGRLGPDAVVLSAALPGIPAAAVIAAIRRFATIPIALGIGADEGQSAAAGLAAGATAVLRRPYQQPEVRLLLGQLAGTPSRPEAQPVLTFGSLELDGPAYQARAGGKQLDLTVREFQLLRVLMQHSDRVVSSDQIRRDVWGGDAGGGNTIAVHVRRLRARLGAQGDIVNVRGVGYRLALPHEASDSN